MNFEEWLLNKSMDKSIKAINEDGQYYVQIDSLRLCWNDSRKQALKEAAKVSKEPLDNPTEEEIAQMAQGMTIGEIKANRIRKL